VDNPPELQQINGPWLTYIDAATLLGKAESAVRQQASREHWPKRKNGKLTEVCVPVEADGPPPNTVVTESNGKRSVTSTSNDPLTALLKAQSQTIARQAETIGRLRAQLDEAQRREREAVAFVLTQSRAAIRDARLELAGGESEA
jgi:hypothetical protein